MLLESQGASTSRQVTDCDVAARGLCDTGRSGGTDSDSESLPSAPSESHDIAETQTVVAASDESEEDADKESGECEEEDDGEDDDWLGEFTEEFGDTAKTGPAIEDKLAVLINSMLAKGISKDKQDALFKELLPPSNVPVVNPKVNGEMWAKMKDDARSADLKMAQVGDFVVKAIIANTSVAAGLANLKSAVTGETKEEVKELMRSSLNAVRAGALALQELNQKRRDNIKRDLKPFVRSVCNKPEAEYGELLLGSNFAERLKQAAQTKTATAQVSGGSRPFLGRGQARHQWRRPRESFRGRSYRQRQHRGRGRGFRRQ